jgi:cytochrome P450 family 307 subfamily A
MFVCFFFTILLSLEELNLKSLKAKFLNKNKRSESFFFRDANNNNSENLKEAPGPKPYPIIGNLPALAKYEIPYQAFTHLSKTYGQIFKLQLGSVPALVVNGIDNIKEVLVTKGNHFDSRPNFRRFYELFAGNKENCKWIPPFLTIILI